MEFAHPEWLNALYLVSVIVVLLVYGAKRRREELLHFTGSHLSDTLAPGRSWRKNFLKAFLKVGGYSLIVISLAGPRFGSQLVKVEREGVDLVIALDTSLSMLAEDMKPNRLEKAKQEIVDLIRGLTGDRIGFVVFAGDAFVMCPLTVDYDAALMFVQSADVDIVSEPGTAIEKAIRVSASLFERSTRKDRVIILVTDGESLEGDPSKAARETSEHGIKIYTIGIGNPVGEPIPLRGTDGSIEGYKKDIKGETVLTRLDEATLQQVAELGGGKFLPATREGLELKVLYRDLAGMEKKAIKGEFIERKKDRFPIFLGLSLLLLALDTLVTTRGRARRRSGARFLHTGSASVLILGLMVFPPAVSAKGIDRGKVRAGNKYYNTEQYDKALHLYGEAIGDTTRTPREAEGVKYNEGNALYMMGRYPEALRKYGESFSPDTVLTGRMLYNRASALVEMNKLDEAVESYVMALRYLPDDMDTRHNLEVALRKRLENQERQQSSPQNRENEEDRSQTQGGEQRGKDEDKVESEAQRDDQPAQQTEAGNEEDRASSSNAAGEEDSVMAELQRSDTLQSATLSREDALRILKALEEQEKELRKAKQKAAFRKMLRGARDW